MPIGQLRQTWTLRNEVATMKLQRNRGTWGARPFRDSAVASSRLRSQNGDMPTSFPPVMLRLGG